MRESPYESRIADVRRQAARAPVLDAHAEQLLAREALQGSETALRSLVASHMRLVVAVADAYTRPGVGVDDLVSEGTLGLLEAAQRFDPERGTRFATYAGWWVRAYIRRYALANRRIVGAPSTRNTRRILWSLRRTEQDLAQCLGRRPSREEVAAALDADSEDVAAVEAALGGRDLGLESGDEAEAVQLPEASAGPEETAAQREQHRLDRSRVAHAMAALSEREREVVRRRLLDEEETSLSSLGASMGVSRERVRQIQERARSKLRSSLAPVA